MWLLSHMALLFSTIVSVFFGAPYDFLGLPKNAAEKAAERSPAFSLSDPIGPVFTEAEKESQRAAGQALLAELRAAKKTFTVPPGDYRLACLQPIVLEGLHDLRIEAQGATFWLDRPEAQTTADCWGLKFVNCRNVKVRGLTLDYDPLLFTQGRIERIDYENGSIDLAVDEGFPLVDYRPLQIIFFRANGDYIPQPPHFHNGVTRGARRTLHVAMKTMDQVRAQSEDPKILDAFEGRSKIGVGDYAVMPFRTGTALQVEQCAQMAFEEVTLYGAPGFAFLESGGKGGHVYKRCKVLRRPGTRRLWGCNADAFHSRLLGKGSRLEACEFANTGDDFLNFHSFWHLATHRFAPDRFAVFPHMYAPFKVGQTIEFFDPVSAASQGQAAIVRIDPLKDPALLEKTQQAPAKYGYIPYHGKPIIVTLDRAVEAADGSLVDSRTLTSPGIVVKDCYFHDAMGRGALVEGVTNITFTNNTWRDCNGGIQMFSCMWFYVEGPSLRGVSIRGNRFLNAGAIPAPVQQSQPVNGTLCMTLVANGGNYLRDVIHNRDLVIDGNTIYRSGNYPILVAYTRNARITGNRIIEPRHYVARIGYDNAPTYYSGADGTPNPPCAVFVTRSENVRLGRNRVEDPEHGASQTVCFGPGVRSSP